MNNWQYELAEAKRNGEDPIPVDMPLWANQLPLVDRLRGDVDHLLQQLPLMRSVTDQIARESYRDQLARAFIQIAYFEARATQLSDKMDEAARKQAVDEIFKNCSQRIEQVSAWLSL